MKARPSGLMILMTVAGTAAALLIALGGVRLSHEPTELSQDVKGAASVKPESRLPPSLDCGFQAFMHSSTAVSFYFDVEFQEGKAPRFYQRAFVSADGTRQSFEGNDRRPWSYSLDGDGYPTIASPDGSTHIVVYGLKLGAAGVFSVEAGIRSKELRNLGGQCRQTNLTDRGS